MNTENTNPEADVIDEAEMLRLAALADRDKSNNRVSKETVLLEISNFLNDKSAKSTTIKCYPVNTPPAQIVTRFKSILKSNNLTGLVWPMKVGDEAKLIKLSA